MWAPWPPLSAAVPLLAVTVAVTAAIGRHVIRPDAQLLQTIQKEEGSIDRLIRDILKLREAKELAKLDQQRDQRPDQLLDPLLLARWHREVSRPPRGHPERHFAYYPSDPEYYQRRRPVSPAPPQPEHGSDRPMEGVQETASSALGLRNFQDGSVAQTVTPDPVGAATDDVREKRPMASGVSLASRAAALHQTHRERDGISDVHFIVAVVGVCAGTVCLSIFGGICYRYLQRRRRRISSESGYPSYGVTGPHSGVTPSSADRKLAQSAQLYHYQHQKQHMMAIQEGKTLGRCSSPSDENSDADNDESEHTVYECPGLAPSGEMEVKNPLFTEDPTPSQLPRDEEGQ